ncbi:twin-arginine translocase subunit TatB [Ketobacter sp. MCCC 1A13808]|uniref:Sec-independent protein translocase protein TatB n=1 Tax=Ketobacter sp. MCCC 1A13808 TaxID=2602738 RepID=UPI000F22FFF2|nr:Sec-independent protein translocase protein TatB [Ketobacter sp. MCCC 1A13808]MVF13137.1 twin-arginine translocase subunit TatB [Ketobacter sp. MCCC 1A13808]RLP54783.1 MAG: twin-arginine translocase subunit TatB [Ketobacter sp.]
MFDIGFFELVLLGIVGLLVLGPERLPHAIRMGSAYMGKIRRAVMNVREEFEREVNMQEIQQRIKQQMDESGITEAHKSLQDLKSGVESQHILPPDPKPAAAKAETDPDTAHNPTRPENEAEPLPETTPPRPDKESPKA